MSSTLPARRSAVFAHWLLGLSLVPLGALAVLGAQADTVANKFTAKLGLVGGDGVKFGITDLLDQVLAPADGAGKVEIKSLILAIIALTILGGIVYFLFGILKTMGGRRGGIETLGQVIFALIVGIAGLQILA